MPVLGTRASQTLVSLVGAAGLAALGTAVLFDRELLNVERVTGAPVVLPAADGPPRAPGRSGTIEPGGAAAAALQPAAERDTVQDGAPPRGARGAVTGLATPPDRRIAVDRVAAVLRSFATGLHRTSERALAATIYEVSHRYRIDPLLTLAVIETESSFRNGAVSFRGARGLMQIRPFVGEELAADLGIAWGGAPTLHDPIANVRMGVHYLAQLRDRFGDLTLALTAYNIGPNAVQALLDQDREVPTGYVRKVLAAYTRYLALAAPPLDAPSRTAEQPGVPGRQVADASR